MKLTLYTYILLLFLFSATAVSQEKKLAKANKQFYDMAYIDAISTYEKVAEKGYKSATLFQRLGDAYYFNAEFEKASKWYAELFALKTKKIPSEYFYRYAQSLKAVGDHQKADAMLAKFNTLAKNERRSELLLKQANYKEVIASNSGRYYIYDSGINSEYADFGSSFYGDKIVFASARDTGGIFRRMHKWTNEAFTDLYIVEDTANLALAKPVKFSKAVNSKFNESTPVFTKDGQTMYFTRNNFLDGKKGKDKKNTTLLKIYKAVFKDSMWTDITSLTFNSDQYNTAHPALSTDEKTLYFASDMPGTLGQSDLFKVEIGADGRFGRPVNLGPEINTEGKETFPFISSDNELYFASDGHPGLGGLDIFMSTNEEGIFSNPINVGEPVNSATDDFALIINTDSKTGFFTSYRNGGKGMDDIYKFKELKPLNCEQLLSGKVTDLETGDMLAGATVVLLDEQFIELQQITADKDGVYVFEVDCGRTYHIRIQKEQYDTKEVKIVIPEISGSTELSIAPEKTVRPFIVGDDIAKKLNIHKIYFDLDQSYIRPDAAVELAKILEVMIEYPTMTIDIRSHTDSRDSHQNNDKLSERRAKATMAWFIEKGIAPERVSGKGYGETQLINQCADGVHCTEEEHQLNRRSEFIILSI